MPPLLPFAQLDFAGTIALGAGRYLVRPPGEADADPDVLVIRTLGAVRAGSRLRRGKPVPLETEPPPDPLTLSRLTLAKAIPFTGGDEARAWLDAVLGDEEITQALLDEVIRTTNRALHAYRVAAPDPYAGDLDIETAIAIRFGYGSGQQVAEGRWDAAAELPERRRRSVRAETIDSVGAQERVAAVLGGRQEIAHEDALLADAERHAGQGRTALAALGLALTIEARARSGGEVDTQLAKDVAGMRERALTGAEIDPEQLGRALKGTRRAIRGRRMLG